MLEGGFDVIFSVLELANKDLPEEYKSSAFEIMATGMDDLIRHIDVFLGGSKFVFDFSTHPFYTMHLGMGDGYLILSSLDVNFHTHAKFAFGFDMPLHIT